MKIIDYTDSRGIFALIYGGSGTGKTHFAGTLAEFGRVLLIDIDKGGKTIEFAKDLQKYRPLITLCSFDQFKDLDQAYKLVDSNSTEQWTKFFGEPVEPFDWVVWDTWSEIQWFMHQQLRQEKDMLTTSLSFRKNLEIQHWGALTDLNKLAIEALRDCKVNQLFTMQEAIQKDENIGTIFGGPAIHGKLVAELPAYFDVVIHTTTDLSGKFCATTKAKGKWPGKTRLAEGQEYILPTAKMIFGEEKK